MASNKKDQKIIVKYYWVVAGIIVGIFSVVGAWYNLNILVGSGDLSLIGSLIVITEYVIVLTILGFIYGKIQK